MKIDTLLGGKMISTYEYREGFIGSDAYKTYAPLKILGLGCIFPHWKIPGIYDLLKRQTLKIYVCTLLSLFRRTLSCTDHIVSTRLEWK